MPKSNNTTEELLTSSSFSLKGSYETTEFSKVGFRASIKIFADVVLSEMWSLQIKENMAQPDKENMAQKFGLTEDIQEYFIKYPNWKTIIYFR